MEREEGRTLSSRADGEREKKQEERGKEEEDRLRWRGLMCVSCTSGESNEVTDLNWQKIWCFFPKKNDVGKQKRCVWLEGGGGHIHTCHGLRCRNMFCCC